MNLLKISLIGRAEPRGSKATSPDRQGSLYKAENAAEKDVKRCVRIVPTSFDPKVHPVGVIRGADVSGKSYRGLARLAGIEPATLGFGGQYSIH